MKMTRAPISRTWRLVVYFGTTKEKEKEKRKPACQKANHTQPGPHPHLQCQEKATASPAIQQCSTCGSEYHLRARCPKSGGGHPFAHASSQAGSKSQSSEQTVWTVWHVSDESDDRIEACAGCYASFEPRLSSGQEGLIVDTGSVGNLTGQGWIERLKKNGCDMR
eukprot:319631-Amphidinium_carterae.1